MFVRALTRQERATFEKGARGPGGLVVRRSQMLLPSVSGTKAGDVISQFGYSHETV